MLLQCLLGGLQHGLVELLGELLGGEALPGPRLAVEAVVGGLFRGERGPHAVEQAGAPLGWGAVAGPGGLLWSLWFSRGGFRQLRAGRGLGGRGAGGSGGAGGGPVRIATRRPRRGVR